MLLGWVHRVRDMGAVIFLDIRDRHGVTQVVTEADPVLAQAKKLKTEMVVAILGAGGPAVARDDQRQARHRARRGAHRRDLRVLNDARRPPFAIADESFVAEETRLRYRYLDLRRQRMQKNLMLRHRLTMAIRRYFDEHGFLEIETPILTKSTPEGARDYLVPSRVHPGEFFALPQSPQIFKQILMIGGLDRYFQIVRCFRDEDLRADRQPEFTQVDVEISFADAGARVFADRAAHRRDLRGGRHRPSRRRSASMPYRGGDGAVRVGQARPAVRHGDRRISGPCFAGTAVRARARGARDRWRACADSSCRAGPRIARAEVDEIVDRGASDGRRRARCGRGTPRRGWQTSAKALGEEALTRALETSARPAPTDCCS